MQNIHGEKINETLYEAKNFYFESDLLNSNTNPVSYAYQRGIDSISFELKNNIDELRYSDVEISYVVTINTLDGKQVVDKSGNTVNEITGKLTNQNIESKKIEFTNLAEGNYVVIAKSKSPYEKTIQANFTLTGNDYNITYEVSDSKDSPVMRLTVITKDYAGDVTINYPEGVSPDSTDSKFSSVNSGFAQSSVAIHFDANSEYTFQFFKKEPTRVFSKENFSVVGS